MPKNIVLLSDGTGNSAAKLFKTNVWRIYDALDLINPDEQVACYDDGVGTSAFRPLALLGGALGFGLKRNVLRLYRFLCEQYEPHDRIYAFGFSRGAFTIRVLAALVADQGIIRVRGDKFPAPGTAVRAGAAAVAAGSSATGVAVAARPASSRTTMTGSELRRLSLRAYQRFRHNFDQTLPIVGVGRRLRDRVFEVVDEWRGRTPYNPRANYELTVDPVTKERPITFLGLWDTVDAYGLPIDELTEGVNRWIWPLSLPEFALSEKVGKACHALSLDDERHTFHPVLWDESNEPQDKARIEDERISQVWFAGAHANVGGGYPNDALSAVSLEWVATEATKKQLRFLQDRLASWTARRDPLGTAYDSRRGVAAYYRYSPRRIQHLTNGQTHERTFRHGTWPQPHPTVTISRPKIHESVFQRIEAAPDFYAPIGLPERYAVVMNNGDIVEGTDNPYEKPHESAMRFRAQEAIWDLVWWRRIAYLAGVAVTVALAASPLRGGADATVDIAAQGAGLPLLELVGSVLPEAVSPWLNYYTAAPWELAMFLGALGAVLVWGRALRSSIRDRMHTTWRWVTHQQQSLRLPVRRGLAYHLREWRHYHGVFAVFRRKVVPHTFGPLVLLCVLALLNRTMFEAFNVAGATCATSQAPAPVGSAGATVRFATAAFCAPTGLTLERGARYELTATFEGARDSTIPVGRADGFSVISPEVTAGGVRLIAPDRNVAQAVLFAVASPFSRLWGAGWFGIVARVGDAGVEQIPLGAGTTTFTARSTGELFLFVNDAIVPLWWNALYANNHGHAVVTIRPWSD